MADLQAGAEIGAEIDALLGALADERLRVFDLEQVRTVRGAWHPVQHPGFHYGLHRRHGDGGSAGRTSASGVITVVDHFATHVDAFCHQAVDGRMYGGVEVTRDTESDRGFAVHGAETIPPFVCRGVLLDAAGLIGDEPRLLEADDLEAVRLEQGTRIGPGDVVLVRTGWARFWAADNDRYREGPGVAASGSRWLADQGVRAVGADTMAWDAVGHHDEELGDFPGHVVLLVQAGIHIFENMRLEDLGAQRCREFLFVAAPLKYEGATAGPARPLALGRPG